MNGEKQIKRSSKIEKRHALVEIAIVLGVAVEGVAEALELAFREGLAIGGKGELDELVFEAVEALGSDGLQKEIRN